MKVFKKVCEITAILALVLDLIILVSLYYIEYNNPLVSFSITNTLMEVGVILFIYIALFCIVYLLKIVIQSITKKDKYDKKEKTKDIIYAVCSLIGTVIIFYTFSTHFVHRGGAMLGKPVIYLYPEVQTEVKVKLINEEALTHTYPKYINEWNVIAEPNGNLVDKSTGRNLYCLYYESDDNTNINLDEGFVIEGKDAIKFLEEKLSILGLNERESNEFIIYWLPKMENNNYNYIRFRTYEEINNYMPLDISPKPDSIIRVVMDFKPLERSIQVKEQELNIPLRTGFTVVEWGGRELK